MYRRRGRPARVKLNWDHVIPFVHVGNPADNWVAACGRCNGIKSDLMFDSPEAARKYVRRMLDPREMEQYGESPTQAAPEEDLPGVPRELPTETGLPKVVLPKVSYDRLLAAPLERWEDCMRDYRLHG